jgi:hypothetical protein
MHLATGGSTDHPPGAPSAEPGAPKAPTSADLASFKGTCVNAHPKPVSAHTTSCCAKQAGKAHCAPTSDLPAGSEKVLESCTSEAGLCVPDSLLASGGATPKACQTKLAGEGVCMSKCIPLVAQSMGILAIIQTSPSGCEADELCAPCIDPRTMMPTGACKIGTLGTCPGE